MQAAFVPQAELIKMEINNDHSHKSNSFSFSSLAKVS
jgi:hypothetical protein